MLKGYSLDYKFRQQIQLQISITKHYMLNKLVMSRKLGTQGKFINFLFLRKQSLLFAIKQNFTYLIIILNAPISSFFQIQFHLQQYNTYLIFMENKESKHLVIVHGYLFEGSGSNIYVQNIALTWKKMGHRVTVICQDRKAASHPEVNQFIKGMPDKNMEHLKPGQLRLIVPDINDLLPVYVWNEYQGYTVKQIQNMTEEQIENHINMTAKCLKTLCQIEKTDKVLTNHALLSPIIAQRALEGSNVNYDVKIHGSAVTYTLRPNKHLIKYSIPGLKGANKIYTGTQYVRSVVKEVFADSAEEIGLANKLQILPPGMDPDKFNISDNREQSERLFLQAAAQKINNNPPGCKNEIIEFNENIEPEQLHTLLVDSSKKYNQRVCDYNIKERWIPFKADQRIILYIGAFINTKGMGQLLLLAPSMIKKNPKLRFVFCGFGTYREHMNQLLYSFIEGNQNKAQKIAKAGNFITQYDIKDYFFKADPQLIKRITILGFVQHAILSRVLPLCTICVVPSKAPEAFGMVTVESMAAGVLPLCNNHSGLADVLNIIEKSFPQIIEITKVQKLFEKLEELINGLLQYSQKNPLGYDGLKKKMRQISVDNFSWSMIANRLMK